MKRRTTSIAALLFMFLSATTYGEQSRSDDGSGIGGTGVKSGDGGIGGTGVVEQANEEMLPERVEMPERIERPELELERPDFGVPEGLDAAMDAIEVHEAVEKPD